MDAEGDVEVSESSVRSISVTGSGHAEGSPDTARVHVGVSVLGRSMAEASEHAAQAMEGVLAAARGKGVDGDSLQTAAYRSHPEYDHSGRARRLAGYRVTNTVRMRIRPIELTSTLLEAVTTAGGDAVNIDWMAFEVEDPTALEREARAAAWRDAMDKATQLAVLAGTKLGPVRSIEETIGGRPRPLALERSALAADAGPPIESGSQRVEISLAVTFDI